MGTIIVSVILVIIVTAAIISLIRSKKRGKSVQCGGDCSKCGGCH